MLLFKAKCPYGVPGDLLYVKETFAVLEGVGVKYKADNPSQDKPSEYWETPLASSLFMPKERSRITLEITAVRPEPVQDISEEDAIAEGCYHGPGAGNYRDARHIYEGLWDSNQRQDISVDLQPLGVGHIVQEDAMSIEQDKINQLDSDYRALLVEKNRLQSELEQARKRSATLPNPSSAGELQASGCAGVDTTSLK